MNYLYLIVNLGAVIVPFLFSFHPRLRFNEKWKSFWSANLLTIIPFLLWDIWFTDSGIWGFTQTYLSGIYLFNLPLEEVLFFICIPYACVYTWHCLSILKWKKEYPNNLNALTYLIIGISIVIAIIFHNQLYTFYTFICLAVLLSILKIRNVKWLGAFYLTYLVLIIPFTIVNGILTGTGIENEIVWYNDSHNFGIRYLTIPIEDVFYGLTLILLNVSLFEYFKKKFI